MNAAVVASAGDDEVWTESIADAADPRPITGSTVQFVGRKWTIRSDEVAFDTGAATRDVLLHPGAVAIVALDAQDRVLLIRQYRHAVGMFLFEPPAGLLDVPGEDPLLTAKRELLEEAGYVAERWDVLVDLVTSPGGSSEAIRVYLARGPEVAPGGRPLTGEAEEGHLPRVWVDLGEAKDLVLSGSVGNASSVVGILAAWSSRESGWSALRGADTPWDVRTHLQVNARLPG